jgi:hypothetical protein
VFLYAKILNESIVTIVAMPPLSWGRSDEILIVALEFSVRLI